MRHFFSVLGFESDWKFFSNLIRIGSKKQSLSGSDWLAMKLQAMVKKGISCHCKPLASHKLSLLGHGCTGTEQRHCVSEGGGTIAVEANLLVGIECLGGVNYSSVFHPSKRPMLLWHGCSAEH